MVSNLSYEECLTGERGWVWVNKQTGEVMASNEHSDLQGNRTDDPYRCELCGSEFYETVGYVIDMNGETRFCSVDCRKAWESTSKERELAEKICDLIMGCNQSEIEGDGT